MGCQIKNLFNWRQFQAQLKRNPQAWHQLLKRATPRKSHGGMKNVVKLYMNEKDRGYNVIMFNVEELPDDDEYDTDKALEIMNNAGLDSVKESSLRNE